MVAEWQREWEAGAGNEWFNSVAEPEDMYSESRLRPFRANSELTGGTNYSELYDTTLRQLSQQYIGLLSICTKAAVATVRA